MRQPICYPWDTAVFVGFFFFFFEMGEGVRNALLENLI